MMNTPSYVLAAMNGPSPPDMLVAIKRLGNKVVWIGQPPIGDQGTCWALDGKRATLCQILSASDNREAK